MCPRNNTAYKLRIDLPAYIKALITKRVSNKDLLDFHLDNLKKRLEADNKTLQTYSNHRTAFNKWLEHFGHTPSDLVGEEFGVDFDSSLHSYLQYLKDPKPDGLGLDNQTIHDRKSIIRKFRESWLELIKSDGLPETFKEALMVLMEAHEVTVQELSRACDINHQTLRNWVNTKKTPSYKAIPQVHRLEDYFQLQRAALTSRLPFVLYGMRNKPVARLTPWRMHQGLRLKTPFALKVWPERLKEEWDRLFKFFTDSAWVAKEGMKRKSSWRIREDDKSCPTAEVKWNMLEDFYGYLCLPEKYTGPFLEDEAYEPGFQEGKGYKPEQLSLAMLSDIDLVYDFIQFNRLRTYKQKYNNWTTNFLAFVVQLLRPETGFLYQSPEFSQRLPKKVAKGKWQAWCAEAHKRANNIITNVIEAQEIKPTRDPFEPIRSFIVERQHPITILWELAENIRRDKPSPISRDLDRAVHYRDLLLVELLTSNPLRISHFSRMTFRRQGAVPNGGDDQGHLYQKPDGSWHLKFQPWEFKNEKGAAKNVLYDVPVVPSLWPSIEEYLYVHRPYLLGAAECDYVFRPKCVPGMTPDKDAALTDRMSPESFGILMGRLTQQYLAAYSCVGFRPHCFRHIVATEWIKNYPDGFEVAAAILHDTPEMVRKTYAWVTPADKITHWNNYYETLRAQFREGKV